MSKPTFVIGDVHGHLDRLEALLKKAGILDECPDCGGDGDHAWDGDMFCPPCGGDGMRRVNFDVEVVQVGDLGHFGADGSPTGDEMCYKYARDWLDIVLWGNHDRAVIDGYHKFGGYLPPKPTVTHLMRLLHDEGKYRLAHSAHGYFISHAGLHAAFKQQPGIDFDRTDPTLVAQWLNDGDWYPDIDNKPAPTFHRRIRPDAPVRDAISFKRNGSSPYGGILWRDRSEKLYDAFPQVFGHSADREGRVLRFNEREPHADGKHWCIDVGGKTEARLAGIWLEEGKEPRIERVDL